MTIQSSLSVFLLFFLPVLAPLQAFPQEVLEECTAGVASGLATTDGRPLLWKTRDASATDNEVIWNTSGEYHFVSVINAGDPSSSWMGVNDQGFAIINTLSTDLTMERDGLQLHNGSFMVYALQRCATVEEFEALLEETNEEGRMTNTNYGVIDATGAAAFFETAGHEYWRYDAANREKGYILRTNFAINGSREDGHVPYSMDRFLQTDELMRRFYQTDKIEMKEIVRVQVRSFGDPEGNLVPLPFSESIDGHEVGYYPHSSSINRNSTVSFAAIQGVLPGEDPRLSTMWTILGQPSTG
ncbi:MAG: carcinine hydrolase/isopenicillin-N N-acyltransferase family protein, partial [Longimicrobiales bacterium]